MMERKESDNHRDRHVMGSEGGDRWTLSGGRRCRVDSQGMVRR